MGCDSVRERSAGTFGGMAERRQRSSGRKSGNIRLISRAISGIIDIYAYQVSERLSKRQISRASQLPYMVVEGSIASHSKTGNLLPSLVRP